MKLQQLNNLIEKKALLLLLAFAIVSRVLIVIFYNTVSLFPDSQDYLNFGALIRNFQFENYPGNRTPGYPFLIALANNSLTIVVLFQLLLGLLNVYLLYDFAKRKTQSINTAFWITFLTTSFIHYIFFEFAILTESLTVTLVIFTFWIIERYQILQTHTPAKYYLLLSIILSFIYLTKPLFIYFSLGFALFYFVKNCKTQVLKTLAKSLLVLLIPFLTYFGWNQYNKANIGYFTNTIYFGINLSQTATGFFEKVPEEDALIRDIFVKHRDSLALTTDYKVHPMTVWRAYDELLKETQLSPEDLSAELGRISINLFKNHPDLYAKQVVKSSYLFFTKEGVLKWNYPNFKNKYFKYGLTALWIYFQQYILVLFNILFLLFSIRKLFLFIKQKASIYDFDLFIVCIVLAGALAQGLVAYGSNSRFAFPFLPLIIYFVVINVLDLKSKYKPLKK